MSGDNRQVAPTSGRRRRAVVLALVACGLASLLVLRTRTNPQPIGQGWGYAGASKFIGQPAVAQPISAVPVPQHPFMAANGRSNMHDDAQDTNTYRVSGPLGIHPQITSTARALLGGECASVNFDRHGRIVTVCMSLAGPKLLLLDPHTLAELASYDLPQRPSTRSFNLRKIVTDTSGGAYFYLDAHDRAVIATSALRIEIVGETGEGTDASFVLEHAYDLRSVVARPRRPDDTVTTVLPDWQGRLWFVTRYGLVGTVEPESGRIAITELSGEEIENSFAIGPDAVYIVSDHALYRFEAQPDSGAPVVIWREIYDRGTRRKPGMINQGSGTTPTLLDNDLVVIADNADPQMHVLVYRRGRDVDGNRLVCQQPVFTPGRSTTENTVIAVGRSIIVENNYGYDMFPTMTFGRTSTPGVVRIDIDKAGDGCHQVWESQEISQTTVPKLSLGNGLVYLYTKDPHAARWIDAYYFTALDFRTGATVYKVLTGTGLGYDNNWAPVTLGPDGSAYVGTVRGLIAVRDGKG
jgi:outer membrane protein assembly factor BamB